MNDREGKIQKPSTRSTTESEETKTDAEQALSEIDLDEIDDTNIEQLDAMSPNLMEQLYSQTFQNVSEGQIVKGRVLQINDSEVLVDVGYKSEGVIPIEEFRAQLQDGSLKVGGEIEVYLEKTEDPSGMATLSKEKADKIKIWDEINRVYENGEHIEGRVISKIKGGLTVDIGVRAFLPGSQIDLRPVRDPERLIGKTLTMKVIKLNKRRGNIVLSRRVILEDERQKLKEKTLTALKEGVLIEGTVKNITEYGAFIDLGGIDGLLHITDMSWGRVNHPSELFQIGDQTEVMVLKFDAKSERVSLGLKQKSKDPWESADEKYPINNRVRGKVISLTDYGAFVELEEGIEGLVHVSEMSWTRRVRHPSKLVSIGDEIEAVVLDLDKENKRISLGMKQAEPNPWTLVEEKYPVGCKVAGRVRNLTNFGAFVELEEGIDGLIHISDMSWTRRVNHPSEMLKKGEMVVAVVTDIDVESERLSLSLKHAAPNPWDEASENYRIGTVVTGKVVRLTDFGVFVELEGGIEGLVHISELARRRVNHPEEVCAVGDDLTMRVIKIEPEERRIGLSIKALKSDDETQVNNRYMEDTERLMPRSTMGDAFKENKALWQNLNTAAQLTEKKKRAEAFVPDEDDEDDEDDYESSDWEDDESDAGDDDDNDDWDDDDDEFEE
ncbi:30S ribosomal protein S1 [bacterium]|nr:30S ribosomal protein S1 [candidate division CSSED10-310 bacterium]